jgi:hypothetical protein
MEFLSASAYMVNTSLPTGFNNFSLFAAASTTNESSVGAIIGCGSTTATALDSTYVSTTMAANNAHLVYANGASQIGITPRLGSGARTFGVTTTGTSGTIAAYQDGTQLSSSAQGSATPTLANFTVAKRPFDKGGSDNVKVAFAAAFQGALSDAQYLSLRSLYKTTLGTGLALP